MRWAPPGEGRDRGSVTAELAVALPAVLVLLTAVLSVGVTVQAQLGCIDAARAGARLAARAEPSGRVLAAAQRLSPRGALVTVRADGGLVRVRVQAEVPLWLPGHPSLTVGSAATALRETSMTRSVSSTGTR